MGKQHEKILDRVTQAMRAARDRDTWKVMIANAKEHGT